MIGVAAGSIVVVKGGKKRDSAHKENKKKGSNKYVSVY